MSHDNPGGKRPGTLRPRNPLHDHALLKKGGAHGKTRKAQRRADKVALKRGEDAQAT